MKQLADIMDQLHDSTVALRRTMHATRRNRRTPDQIRAALARAQRALYRSRVIKRALHERFRVQ